MPLGTEVTSATRCVRWGRSSRLKGAQPQFSAHVCCDHTAGWMKTPLGTEVDLGSGHIVLDGDPAPPREREWTQQPPPHFSAHVYCGYGRPSQLLLSCCKRSTCQRLWCKNSITVSIPLKGCEIPFISNFGLFTKLAKEFGYTRNVSEKK